MNPRIKELALEAGGSHYPEVNTTQLIQFAESVVRECAKVARNKTLRSTGVSEEFTGTVYIEDEIRNHFGVK